MRSSITVFITLLLCSNLYAQNWNFISPNERYHFQHIDDSIPLHTILIDSSQSKNKLTTNFLNRLFLPCDTCSEEGYYLDNQPSFLQREFVFSQVTSTVTLQNPEQYIINLPGNTIKEWWFDVEKTQKAAIDTVIKKKVFDIEDSVAIIIIENKPQIEISKKYGLLKYFDYTLSGLENSNLGKCLPGYKEFYDFEVGDVFMYETRRGGSEGSEGGSLKRTVKTIEDDGENIDVKFFESYWSEFYPFEDCVNRNRTEALINETFQYANTYPNQKIPIYSFCFENCLQYYYINDKPNAWTFSTIATINEQLVKVIGYEGTYSNATNIALPFNKREGDLYWYDEGDYDLPAEFEFQYAKGLGMINLTYMEHEDTRSQKLIGYIKNEETFGSVREGSCTNSISEAKNIEIEIYPNPSDGKIKFEISDLKLREVTLYYTDGQFIDRFMVSSGETYHFEHLSAGTYLIQYQSKNKNEYIKWIKQ